MRAVARKGAGPRERTSRAVRACAPGRRGGRRLRPPCWTPQIRHKPLGSGLKKLKNGKRSLEGASRLLGGPEKAPTLFFIRGGGVAMETRTAGERAAVGAAVGEGREPGPGRRRDPRRGEAVRTHVDAPVSRRLVKKFRQASPGRRAEVWARGDRRA